MAITRYTGQPLKPGMIVCRRSVMTNGICARPVMIVRVKGSRLYVRAWGDEREDMQAVNASTVVFIADTWDDGNAMAAASSAHLADEQRRMKEYLRGVAERRNEAIESTIKARA